MLFEGNGGATTSFSYDVYIVPHGQSVNLAADHSAASFDGAVRFERVNESGEYKYGSLMEGGETYQLGTFGKIVAFTRQMIINDDLSALERLPMLFGNAAADLESDIVYGILTANPKMSDGIAVFDAKHNNVGVANDNQDALRDVGKRMTRTFRGRGA